MHVVPKVRIGLLITILLSLLEAHGQVKVILNHADILEGRSINNTFLDIAKGNVSFTHESTKIFCDSALIYKDENRIEAFGRVRIIENDSTTITARRANYDGNSRLVEFRRNVVFTQKGGVQLFTDNLNYQRDKKIATYFKGGKLVDSVNTLRSVRGYYNEYTKIASFGEDVHGQNPDWTLVSDTLQYNTFNRVIFFHSPTTLTNLEGETADYNSGSYNTDSQSSSLRNGKFATKTYLLEGVNIEIDDFSKIYTAQENVLMIAKNDDVIITGQNAVYDKKKGVTKIWNRTLMKKMVAVGDTMYLTADTLMSIENADGDDRLLAYHNVRIFKSDLQGVADSLAYHPRDSVIYFYNNPIMWAEDTQMSADTIDLQIANNTIDKMHMNVNSFIISKDSIKNFNQVKGRLMTTFFKDSKIDKVDVNGNGQSIYFVLEENEKDVMGMNSVECSNMKIKFKDNMVRTITFYINAEGDFIPPHEIKGDAEKLEGFDWKAELKPNLQDLLDLNIK